MSRLVAAGRRSSSLGRVLAGAAAAAAPRKHGGMMPGMTPLRVAAAGLATEAYPDKWVPGAEKELKGKPVDSLLFHTPEGISIKPVYGAHDIEGLPISQGD